MRRIAVLLVLTAGCEAAEDSPAVERCLIQGSGVASLCSLRDELTANVEGQESLDELIALRVFAPILDGPLRLLNPDEGCADDDPDRIIEEPTSCIVERTDGNTDALCDSIGACLDEHAGEDYSWSCWYYADPDDLCSYQ